MQSYNPYRGLDSNLQNAPIDNSVLSNKTLNRLSIFGRNYGEYTFRNAKTTHANEDPNNDQFSYDGYRNKLLAISTEGTNVASLSPDYLYKIQLFKRYAMEPDINYYVAKLANEIITYTDTKKFCDLKNLNDQKYSEAVIQRARELFLEMYNIHGFNVQSRAYDTCMDYLVEGYIVKEIVYDSKRKKIQYFQTIDPATIAPIIDEETGIKLWVQNIQSNNPRIILDSDIIYLSYSGSSKYSSTSYIEPMIRPYNELKGLERTKIQFNIINSTMHKNISVPLGDIPKQLQEAELLALSSMYDDNLSFDSYEGITYINGSKNLPYSKTAWFIQNSSDKVTVENEAHGFNDINEDVTLNWFRNNFKQSTKFPINKLDQASGGGTVYNFGSDVTNDDYNFEQFIELIRSQFQDILIKPIYIQLCLEFPDLLDSDIYSDLDLNYFGNDDILQAKKLNILQAKFQIGYELTNNFKGLDGEKPYLHPRLVAEKILELPKELLDLNDLYWKKYGGNVEADGGGGGDFGSDGGDDFGGGDDGMDFGGDDGAIDDIDTDMDFDDSEPIDDTPVDEPVE